MGSSSPRSVCAVCSSRSSSVVFWGIGSRVGFSSSEVYSSKDDVSEFSGVEMVGDECCP